MDEKVKDFIMLAWSLDFGFEHECGFSMTKRADGVELFIMTEKDGLFDVPVRYYYDPLKNELTKTETRSVKK